MKHNCVYVSHILHEIEFILQSVENLTFDSFSESELYTRAFFRSIEIIGEAVKNLSQEFKDLHPGIEWRKLSGMRDRLIHQYFNVDYEILWDVVKNKLPEIQGKLQRIHLSDSQNI
ncbi:MAG: DUF86 domain-containing protein [Ignavibacteriales bacterium]|nr:DUF86 domain-containing protein [Ignavibacteriales bacterium]